MADPQAATDSVPAVVAGISGLAGVFGFMLRVLSRANDRAHTANERTVALLRAELRETSAERDTERRARTAAEADAAGWRQRALTAEAALFRLPPPEEPTP